jgi:hypothetical protein
MRLYVIAPFVLALAACAAPVPTTVVAMSDPNAQPVEMECHQETSTGSNMIHTVCHKKQTDGERALIQASFADQLHVLDTHSLKKSD